MDVKIIRNQEAFVPHFQALKQEFLHNAKTVPVRNEIGSRQRYQPTYRIKDKLALLNKEPQQENVPHEGQALGRYHSDMMLSLSRRTDNKVFASNFLHGSAHFVKQNIVSSDENGGSLNNRNNVKSSSLNSKLSVGLPTDQNQCNAAKKMSVYSSEQNNKTDNQKSVVPAPLVEKVDIHTKVKGSGRKSRKIRAKSGKKKRAKSALKKRKSHKNNETMTKEVIFPVKKRLDSCFSLYTSQQNKEKPNEQSSYKHNLPDKLKSAGFLNIRTSGSKTSHGFRERPYLLPPQHSSKSNKLNLPPTTLPRKNHPKSAKSDLNHHKNTTPTNSSSAPLIAPLILRDIKSLQINKEIVSFPPAPICAKSPTNSVQVTSSAEQQKINLLTKAYAGEGTLPVKLSFNGKYKRDHSLGERLSLIHSYGTAYQAVTKQMEMQHKKEQALKHHLSRAAERISREKKKNEQRKKVYALNKLMTKLEHEKFTEFMNSLKPANPPDEIEP